MVERNISEADITTAVLNGEVVEDYSKDLPYPSKLVYLKSINGPLHVVFAESAEAFIIITVYVPTSERWESDFKTRK